MATKKCTKCGSSKELIEYYKHKQTAIGVMGKCKTCCKIATIWRNINSRCYDTNYKYYGRYGARGIRLCKEWQDFSVFEKWYKKGHSKGMQIDRKNNDLGYSPRNCHFVTSAQNCRNRSNTKINEDVLKKVDELVCEGKRIFQIAKITGIDRMTITSALKGQSWKDYEFSEFVKNKYRKEDY